MARIRNMLCRQLRVLSVLSSRLDGATLSCRSESYFLPPVTNYPLFSPCTSLPICSAAWSPLKPMRLWQGPYLIKTKKKKERKDVGTKSDCGRRARRVAKLRGFVSRAVWRGAVIIEMAPRTDYAEALSENCVLRNVDFYLSPFQKCRRSSERKKHLNNN